MAREQNRLTALKVRKTTKPGKYHDGAGLYLVITPTGTRNWIFRWRSRVTGKLRDRGLGPAWDVSLEQAREKAKACRELVRNGGNPIDDASADLAAKRAALAKQLTLANALPNISRRTGPAGATRSMPRNGWRHWTPTPRRSTRYP